jgi:hypothetical protein
MWLCKNRLAILKNIIWHYERQFYSYDPWNKAESSQCKFPLLLESKRAWQVCSKTKVMLTFSSTGGVVHHVYALQGHHSIYIYKRLGASVICCVVNGYKSVNPANRKLTTKYLHIQRRLYRSYKVNMVLHKWASILARCSYLWSFFLSPCLERCWKSKYCHVY